MPLVPSRLAPLEMEADDAPPVAPVPPKRRRPVEPPILPPAALADDGRFLRGTLTHALLEHLPAFPRRHWAVGSRSLSGEPRRATLRPSPQRYRDRDAGRAARIPPWRRCSGPTAGRRWRLPPRLPHPGRLRRRRAPDRQDRSPGAHRRPRDDRRLQDEPPAASRRGAFAEAYLLQLAAYRLGVARIFPGVTVRAAILWTDGPAHHGDCGQACWTAMNSELWQLDPASLDA